MFGVKIGKFLGFLLTIERGIEANPDKCVTIINMRSPRNMKELQHLIGGWWPWLDSYHDRAIMVSSTSSVYGREDIYSGPTSASKPLYN